MTHFQTQAVARGITQTNTAILQQEIAKAWKDGNDEYLERTTKVNDGCHLYRFRVIEGVFYALISATGIVKTVYTQELARRLKQHAKFMRGRKWEKRKS